MAPLVLVFEKRPRWAPELQRQFADEEVRIRACRSTADVDERLRESPGSLVVLDLRAGSAACLQFLAAGSQKPVRPPMIVVGSLRTAELEWPMRELGATEFLPDPPGDRLAAVCRRQWQATS